MSFLRKISFRSASVAYLMPRVLQSNVQSFKNKINLKSFSVYSSPNVFRNFLQPSKVVHIPACGLKIKGVMRLRCKDCYYVRREGRLYVMCKSFPRHKQTQVVPAEKRTWIFSHACQSKLRPY